MSRGLWHLTDTRTRRGFALLWAALFVFSLLLQYGQMASPASVVAASGLKAGTVQGFEIDGDLKCQNASGNPGGITPASLIDGTLTDGDDWLDNTGCNGKVDPATPPSSILTHDLINSTSDDGFGGGAKETDTRTWSYDLHKPTPKDDVHDAMAYAKFVGGSAFFYAGATRIVNNGDTHIDFELNRKPFKVWSDGVSKPDRSVGDVLISLEFSNGGSDPIVTVYKVTAVTNFASGQDTTYGTDLATAAAVHSATNFVDLPNQGLGYSIPAFEFAETSIDLAALGINTACPGLSQGHIRTRSGGDIDSSQLKDNIQPFPIDLNNCGKLRIEKRDENGDLLGGASFHLDEDPRPGQTGSLNVTDGGANDPDGTANGIIEFDPATPDSYTVTETAAPPNYSIDNPNGVTKTLPANGSVTFTFTDTPLPPDLKITKVADNDSVDAGQEIGFVIQVTNDGPGIAKNVTLSDPLPTKPGISWSEDPDRDDCTITSNTLNCDFGNLPDGAHATVHVVSATTKDSCGVYDNTATASADNNDDVEASDSTTVNCADIDVDKVADADSVDAGQPIGFTVTLTNNGTGTATGLSFSDPLPTGAGISWSIDPASAGWSIVGGNLVYTPTSLAGGASTSVHITSPTTGASCGTYTNTATVTTGNDGQDSASDSTTVNCASIDVAKVADDASVNAGEPIGFTVTITNNGDGAATGLAFTDVLPTGSGISWSIDPASAGWSIAGGNLVYSPTTLAAHSSTSVHIVSNTTSASCGTYDNTATVTTGNDGQDSASDSTTVNCADIDVDKVADAESVNAGEPIGFTVTITNNGAGAATGLAFTDVLPTGSGISWSIDPASAGWSIAGGNLVYSPTSLAAGASTSVHIVSDTTAASCGTYDNTASATTANDGSSEASDSTTVNCANIAIEKVADDGTVEAGETIGFTVTVTNNGDGTAKGVLVTDPLPTDAGLAWVLDDDAESACVLASGTVTCGPLDLASGDSFSFHISSTTTVDTAANDPVVNEACVTTTNDGNACGEDEVIVLTHSLIIDKTNDAPIETLELPAGGTADLPTADEGSTLTYTLTYTFGGDPVTNGIITDELPVGVTWVDGSAVGDAQFTFIGYDIPSRTLTWMAANVSASGSVSYKVTVDAGAAALLQPLENLATIDSDQTVPDDAFSDIFVPVIPQGETSPPTQPPTDTIGESNGTSTPGLSLPLVVLALGGLMLLMVFVTPVPATARNRKRR
jgi:uncharacterized repeat protein (TIGR01451 family)